MHTHFSFERTVKVKRDALRSLWNTKKRISFYNSMKVRSASISQSIIESIRYMWGP